LEGKTCVVSGSGNVAIYAIQKLQMLGAKVVACSDSDSVIYDADGIDLPTLRQLKEVERKRLRHYAEIRTNAKVLPPNALWTIPCQVALPCATQNELNGDGVRSLIANGCILVGEGANMPTTPEGIRLLFEANIPFGPGKAANAGGVATSALEMQQNASRDAWTFEHTERRLHEIMSRIHQECYNAAEEFGSPGNYVQGANIVGFRRVAEAMLAFGII
jgi:glutamate dehydrogenase (NADP+)